MAVHTFLFLSVSFDTVSGPSFGDLLHRVSVLYILSVKSKTASSLPLPQASQLQTVVTVSFALLIQPLMELTDFQQFQVHHSVSKDSLKTQLHRPRQHCFGQCVHEHEYFIGDSLGSSASRCLDHAPHILLALPCHDPHLHCSQQPSATLYPPCDTSSTMTLYPHFTLSTVTLHPHHYDISPTMIIHFQ